MSESYYGLSADPLAAARAALDDAHGALGRMLAADTIESFERDARRLIGWASEVVFLVQTIGHDESKRLGRSMETEESLQRMWFDFWFAFEVRTITTNVLAQAWATGDRNAFAIVQREAPATRFAVDELCFGLDDRPAFQLCVDYLHEVTRFYDAAADEVARLML